MIDVIITQCGISFGKVFHANAGGILTFGQLIDAVVHKYQLHLLFESGTDKHNFEMFRKVNVPVLGIVENMSLHVCSQCGHQEPIFGAGGGERIAAQYETTLLGQLPLSLSIREQADGGRPTVVAAPDGEVAATFRAVARAVVKGVSSQEAEGPSISFGD